MSEKVFNVLDYGAVADGVTLNSAAVQAAVDACAEAGGGIVSFPAGDFVLSTVFLKSNVTVRIEKGARILGSLDFYDYAPEEAIDYPAYHFKQRAFSAAVVSDESYRLTGLDIDRDSVKHLMFRIVITVSEKNFIL